MGKNDAIRDELTKYLRSNPGWKPLSEMVMMSCKYGHKHTPYEIGGILGATPGVTRYRATDGTSYYRWVGDKA